MMNHFVSRDDLDWMRQHKPTQSIYTAEDCLLLSIRIQQAYEQNRPLLVIFQGKFGLQQYCGYIDGIDPEERFLELRNGTIQKVIDFAKILNIEVI